MPNDDHGGGSAAAAVLSPSHVSSPSLAVARVDGNMSPAERRSRLWARGTESLRVVANSQVLTTGVDVPETDLVIFANSKRSHVSILQAMGRAARASPGKTVGHVLLPMRMGELAPAADPATADSEPAFNGVVEVMRAFVTQDEELREALGGLLARPPGKAGLPPSIEEWPEQVRGIFETDNLPPSQLRQLEKHVHTAACYLADPWEQRYGVLKRFWEREGHANVPRGHTEEGEPLGSWLDHQRMIGRRGDLGVERRGRLESLGVRWGSLFDAKWEAQWEQLGVFKAREGHADVPTGHTEGGLKLGVWLKDQRRAKKKGTLSEERRDRLEALGSRGFGLFAGL